MLEDDRTVRTLSQVTEEIQWILGHDDPRYFRSFAQVLRYYSPGAPATVNSLLTLSSDDAERFLFDLRRAITGWAITDDATRRSTPHWD